MTINEVRAQLTALADPNHAAFSEKLTPGATGLLGVRIPAMRGLAKQIASDGLDAYVPGDSFEEVMIEGLALGYAKLPLGELLARLERFVPKIDNWAVCDSCTMTYKFMQKHRDEVWPWLMGFLDEPTSYGLRFVLVALLAHFVTDDYIERVLQVVDGIQSEHYYVRMGAAWLVSGCYVKYPKLTHAYLEQDHLDDFTHNKSIQKIRESYRVSDEDKQALMALKRGGKKK